jgi:hypothetical protein
MKYKIMIQLLLTCACIVEEEIEAVIFSPKIDSPRTCKKHGNVKIMKVGSPFRVEEKEPLDN